MVMDDIDRKILKLLQDNARVSLKTIAENTFLSSPAVSARIEKLEKDGVIAGYHAQVDPMKLGYHIIAFINLDVTPEDKPKFYAYAESIPNVLECNCVTGEYSMLLKVPEYHGTGYFHWAAAEIRKDQHPDRIFHPCGSAWGGCRRVGGWILPDTDNTSLSYCSKRAIWKGSFCFGGDKESDFRCRSWWNHRSGRCLSGAPGEE